MQDDFPLSNHSWQTIESIAESILGIEGGAFPVREAGIPEFIERYPLSVDLKKQARILFSLFRYSPLLNLKFKTFSSLSLEEREKIPWLYEK